eukprot:TRINITY_DN4030_c0_g1_i5.p2 TRINITY_DN4030_c0_g1~~TRINITY_DN4030_c0_g1_i5.p2  ORF type:complete len:356 (+),score=124.94 TRINITY_DN4030_c0_g1_i5:128-1195(+)
MAASDPRVAAAADELTSALADAGSIPALYLRPLQAASDIILWRRPENTVAVLACVMWLSFGEPSVYVAAPFACAVAAMVLQAAGSSGGRLLWEDGLQDWAAVLRVLGGAVTGATANLITVALIAWAAAELYGLQVPAGAVFASASCGCMLYGGVCRLRLPSRRAVVKKPRPPVPSERRVQIEEPAAEHVRLEPVSLHTRAATMPVGAVAAAREEDADSPPLSPEASPAGNVAGQPAIEGIRIPRAQQAGGVTYFLIEVSAAGQPGWVAPRRYKQFREAFNSVAVTLKEQRAGAPKFPGKTVGKCSGRDLDRRRKELEVFLADLVARAPRNAGINRALQKFLQGARRPAGGKKKMD